jgi:hypothetical protein
MILAHTFVSARTIARSRETERAAPELLPSFVTTVTPLVEPEPGQASASDDFGEGQS